MQVTLAWIAPCPGGVLCPHPTGPLVQKLSDFWQQKEQINAQNVLPTSPCQGGSAAQHQLPAPLGVKSSAPNLELYTSSDFTGLLVREDSTEVLRKCATDFAAETVCGTS